MVSVWYVGSSDEAVLTTEDWVAAGISGRPDVSWNEANGWSLPHSMFTSPQLTWLQAAMDWLINQADTPRNGVDLDINNRRTAASIAYVQNVLMQQPFIAASRQVVAGDGLLGGGPLVNDVTISVDFGTADGQVPSAVDPRIVLAQSTAEKNAASGYAGLNGSSKIAIAQVPTGTTGSTVPFGNDSRFTDQRTPADASVTDAKVAPAAGILASKLDTASLNTAVRVSRLDQMALPTAAVDVNSQRVVNVGTPSSTGDAATKGYVDAARQGFAGAKDPVRCAVSANVNLASPGATLDGVTMVANDRFLARAQTTTTQAGIYVWNGSAVAATRALDADAAGEVLDGTTVAVAEGTDAGKIYIQTATPSGAPGAWTQVWTAFATGGSTYTGSTGITLVGSDFQLSVPVTVARGGTGSTTAATARTALGAVAVGAVVTITALTAGVETLINHGVGTVNAIVQIRDATSKQIVQCAVRMTSTQIGVTSDVAVSSGALEALVLPIGS